MRYDYRNDYKDMDLEGLKSALAKLQDRLLDRLGACLNADDLMKRISYVEKKIAKATA